MQIWRKKIKKYRLLLARATENANCGSYFTTCCSYLKTLMWAFVMSCWLLLASLTTLCRLPDGAHFWDILSLLTLYQNCTFCHFLEHNLSCHFTLVIYTVDPPLKCYITSFFGCKLILTLVEFSQLTFCIFFLMQLCTCQHFERQTYNIWNKGPQTQGLVWRRCIKTKI